MIKFEIEKFSNGLRLVTAPLSNTQAVTVLVLVGVGSRFEKNFQAGISHFLEHMLFKGSKKYPHYQKIAHTLDGLGAQFNAFTSEEYTGYYVRSSADHFEKISDVLADIYFHPIFPPRELEKERGVINEEINMYRDQPTAYVSELFQELVLGGALGRPVIGTKRAVDNLKRAELVGYHRRMYQTDKTIVVVAGASGKGGQAVWKRTLRSLFGKSRPSPSPAPRFRAWKPPVSKKRVRLQKRQIDQAHFLIGLPSFAKTSSAQPSLKLLTNLLGGMMSSRLFEEVREKRGLAYYVSAGNNSFHDTGIFYVRAGVKLAKAEDAVRLVISEVARTAKEKISNAELQRGRENIKGSIYLGLEDSYSVAQYLATRLFYWNEIKQPEQVVKELEETSASQIQKTAKTLWGKGKFYLAIIGPYNSEQKFVKLLS